MPKIFSEKDREAIKDKLVVVGAERFQRFGLRKTSVEELAHAAGIAKGTFYHFFKSKEDLCMEIFDREQIQIESIIQHTLEQHNDPQQAFRAVLDYGLEFLASNSIIQQLRELNEFALLARRVGEERLAENLVQDAKLASTIIRALEEKGARVPVSPEILAGVLRAMVMTAVQQEEIGVHVYPEVIDNIFDWVAKGVATKELAHE